MRKNAGYRPERADMVLLGLVLVLSFVAIGSSECDGTGSAPTKAASGVEKAEVDITVGPSGLTVEQANVKRRLEEDNTPGTIKHLYVISAYSGQVLIYSTVKVKVTSSGKRLSPYTVGCTDGEYVNSANEGIDVRIGNVIKRTEEVLQDDGTYGASVPYIYWYDINDRYHQHYITGGQIVHVSAQPLVVPDVVLNMEIISE